MRQERANAKINLYLDVVSRRENGYHNLVSVMQTVSLCDFLTVDFLPSEHTSVSLSVSGNPDIPVDCRNLAYRAAELFLRETGRHGSVRITLEKHIPSAAGLAGGSADAAAVFRAMNRLCGNPLSPEELSSLGARLGADIPFCIKGGTAIVTGIGDVTEPFPPMPDCLLVVAKRGEGVSTPEAYGMLDRLHGDYAVPIPGRREPESMREHFLAGDLRASCVDFYNVFEEVVPPVREEVSRLIRVMTEGGALCARMSGSGPSVFGVFTDAAAADRVCTALRESGAEAFVCHPTGACLPA